MREATFLHIYITNKTKYDCLKNRILK
uniref:Uncharacterized protein n=1 Tax=Anguilla anguilla TaxID=7936 RepID=A0A0E9QT71_ANGAN